SCNRHLRRRASASTLILYRKKKKAPNLRNPALPDGLSMTLYHKKEALALGTYCALQELRYLYYIKLVQKYQ
ncbi:MAG: hypothetical protein Q4F61_03780, partial [Candidatus Saccharibacteria bacterium]|nr:hypothetical protein [Candidatus Saccharibacteria bacterium]